MALAQARLSLTPSVSVSEAYDDNIFSERDNEPSTTQAPAAPGEPQPAPTPVVNRRHGPVDDFITRGTVGLKGGYESKPLSVVGGYSISGDAYADNSDLNTLPSEQAAIFNSTYATEQRLQLSFAGRYASTQEPRELNSPLPSAESPTGPSAPTLAPTSLESRRAHAEYYDLGPAATYRLTPLTSANAGFTYAHSRQVGSTTSETYLADGGLARQMTPLDVVDLRYSFIHFRFENPPGATSASSTGETTPLPREDTTDSSAVLLGWTRHVTQRIDVILRGGPRFTEGDIKPEAMGEISYRLERGRAGFRYDRTLSTAVGQSGPIDTESFAGFFDYEPLQRLLARATASLSRNSQGSSDADIYTAGVTLGYRWLEWLSFFASYQFSDQRGELSTFDTAPGSHNDHIRRNVALVGVEAAQPFRVY